MCSIMDIAPTLSFADHLQQEAANGAPRRKGERTRHALRIALIDQLDSIGYQNLRLSDVCLKAGISMGSFYAYYADKRMLTLSVVDDFQEFAYQLLFAKADESRSAFEAICFANRRWLRLVRANFGLMKCVLQLSETEPEFAARYDRISHRLYHAIAVSVIRRRKLPIEHTPALTLVAYALGAMMDELARKLIVTQNAELAKVVADCGADDDSIAEALAVIWHRALYGTDPDTQLGVLATLGFKPNQMVDFRPKC